MKNIFNFILKTLSVLKIFKFLSRRFGHVEKMAWLDRWLTSKFMTSQPGLQTVAIYILPNISQGKGNESMKLIEHNKKKNSFLQKLYIRWGKKISSRPLFIFKKG